MDPSIGVHTMWPRAQEENLLKRRTRRMPRADDVDFWLGVYVESRDCHNLHGKLQLSQYSSGKNGAVNEDFRSSNVLRGQAALLGRKVIAGRRRKWGALILALHLWDPNSINAKNKNKNKNKNPYLPFSPWTEFCYFHLFSYQRKVIMVKQHKFPLTGKYYIIIFSHHI